MSNKNIKISSGIAFPLFLVFLVLKLTNTIDWSWWWVTCPLWIGFAVFIAMALFIGVIGVIGIAIGVKLNRER